MVVFLHNKTQIGNVRNASAFVSMGAVRAIAPTVFESVGASTHGFW